MPRRPPRSKAQRGDGDPQALAAAARARLAAENLRHHGLNVPPLPDGPRAAPLEHEAWQDQAQRDLHLGRLPYGTRALVGDGLDTAMTQGLQRNAALHERALARIAVGRLGTPEDFAGIAAFLASSASDYITGVEIPVDGGYLWGF